MPKPGCAYNKCPFTPLPTWERLLVSFTVAGIIVAKPLANSLGLNVDETIINAQFIFRVSMLFPLLAWGLAVYFAYREATDHHVTLVVNAMGIPGTILGIALILSK